MCKDDRDHHYRDHETGFANLGALADYITANSYFGPKQPPVWETHERIEQPDDPATTQG